MSPRLGPLDLLQERRRASGALEPGGPMPPAQGLLLRGAALGAGCTFHGAGWSVL